MVPDRDVRERRWTAGPPVGDLVDRFLSQLGEGARLPVAKLPRREERIEAALQTKPGPGGAQVDERLGELAQRLDDGLPSSTDPE